MASFEARRADIPDGVNVAELELSSLFESHRNRVYRFCLTRLRDREEAADAVQDTYTKAWIALRGGYEVRQPLAWLLTIAANVCTSRYRAKSARPVETQLFDDTEASEASVTYLSRAELAGLPAALRALPDGQRRAFVLRELRGCSYDEIGDDLGVSQSSVAALLHRARRTVATSLAGAGRRVLVVLPMPPVLRSAFEEGGAVVTATAATVAVTAAGTMWLVGPQLPLGHSHSAAAPVPARSTPAAAALANPFWALSAALMPRRPRAASSRAPRDGGSAPTSLVFRSRAVGAAGASALTAASSLPPSSAPAGTLLVPTFPSAPADGTQTSDGPPSQAVASQAVASQAAAPQGQAADAPTSAGGEPASLATTPPTDAGTYASGGPADPGSDGLGHTNTDAPGRPADPGSNGLGHTNTDAPGRPADPGSNGLGHTNTNAPGRPADPGSNGLALGQTKSQDDGQPAGSDSNGLAVGHTKTTTGGQAGAQATDQAATPADSQPEGDSTSGSSDPSSTVGSQLQADAAGRSQDIQPTDGGLPGQGGSHAVGSGLAGSTGVPSVGP